MAGGGDINLEAGNAAEIGTAKSPREVAGAPEDAFAWERGTLVFTNASLSEIAASISRYRSIPVRMLLSAGREPRITAVVQIADIESFLLSLPAIVPVRVVRTPNETRIVPR